MSVNPPGGLQRHQPARKRHNVQASRQNRRQQAYIRLILSRKPLFFRFPMEMEQHFLARRARESLEYIEIGRLLLVLMYAVIVLEGFLFFGEALRAHQYALLVYHYVPVAGLIALIINARRIRLIREHFHPAMFVINFGNMVLISTKLFLTEDFPYYTSFASYDLMITMLLVTFGIRFTFSRLAVLFSSSALCSLVLALLAGWPIDGLRFANAFLLYGMVMLGLSAIMERQDRLAFLQELLVDHQAHELQRINRKLDKIAHEDTLTGIANRRCFDEVAHREWERAQRDQLPLSMLLLDVDYFKRFNDTYGHAAGDRCLQAVAQVLCEALMRPADLVARYGGEEFVVLLPNTDERGALLVATRIQRWIDALLIPHASSEVCAHVTVSQGIATVIPQQGMSLLATLKMADEALYQAKEQGRHQFRLHEPLKTSLPSGETAGET